MKLVQAIKAIDRIQDMGKWLFTRGDLITLFDEDHHNLATTISKLISNGILTRVCNGLYAGRDAKKDSNLLMRIAAYLRPDDINYVSNETVLSWESVISQQMFDRITIMTTGRRGIFRTPFGIVEMNHTKRSPQDILQNTSLPDGWPIRIADKHTAARDLRRIGRNVDMIDLDALNED